MSCGGPAIPALFFEMAPLSGPPYAWSGVYLFHRGLTFCQEGKLSHLNWILETLARKDRQQSQTCVLSEDVFESVFAGSERLQGLPGRAVATNAITLISGWGHTPSSALDIHHLLFSLSLSLSVSVLGPGLVPISSHPGWKT